MTISQQFVPEFKQEMKTTRTLLAVVPEDKADWKPHEKSMSLGQLTIHLSTLPEWISSTIRETELDLNPPGGPAYVGPQFVDLADALDRFDKAISAAGDLLEGASDEDWKANWTLRSGDNVYFTLPRTAVLRSFVLNHVIHHRAQLGVYLRLLDVPVPQVYGPTADFPG